MVLAMVMLASSPVLQKPRRTYRRRAVFSNPTTSSSLLPVEVAPDVLAVNSDFDEGRIDPETGYAIPDCDDVPGVDRKTGAGNGELRIDTEREHLDGLYANDERVTDDMHKGWFGVNPTQLGDEFWDGATVTIRKIDKIDEDTGRKESGQVRFYAKWGDPKFGIYYGIIPYDLQTLAPNNLVTSGVNGKPGEGVYGSTSTIPDDAEFWMEGVRPGKITLEWRLQKGDIDVKHEQTFLVATQKSKQEWLDEVYYQIKLQSSEWPAPDPFTYSALFYNTNDWVSQSYSDPFPLDLNQYNPNNGIYSAASGGAAATHNYAYIQSIYLYYAQLFKQNEEELYWAGMAKVAGASVYAGMADMHIWKRYSSIPSVEPRVAELSKVLNGFMLVGNKDIFNDMSWSHHAYASSGIWALDYLREQQSDDGTLEGTPLTDYDAWDDIDKGIQDEDVPSLHEGNEVILRREQEIVMQPLYNVMKTVSLDPGNWFEELGQSVSGFVMPPQDASGKINIDAVFSLNAKNPINQGLGPTFQTAVPGGSLSDLDDRWSWISNDQNGMLQMWLGTSQGVPGANAEARKLLNNIHFTHHANVYNISGASFPPAW
jgi:hypothetical protein